MVTAMNRRVVTRAAVLALWVVLMLQGTIFGQEVRLIQRAPDPHGTPRPARKARDVPLRTSIYFELGPAEKVNGGRVLPESVAVRLQAEGGEPIDLLQPCQRFAAGASGWIQPKQLGRGVDVTATAVEGLAVYVELGEPLKPSTTYSVRVTARSQGGAELPAAAGTWSFITKAAPTTRSLTVPLDLSTEPVRWHGAFFSGICNVVFCTRAETFGPTYDLMDQARKEHPRAWAYHRDFWMTGTEDRQQWPPDGLPNIVRERETRRITAMDLRDDGVLLHLEDFFGHQQYGIASGRPVSEDYHPGDEVLIADGVHDARSKVLTVDGKAGTVLVGSLASPQGGWKIAYGAPLPERENPDMPGLFPLGGCYLRKFRPHGTPCYYWGRLDKEWDLVHRRHGRRLLVNFADAPGDLAVDGRNWTTVKDYPQWHEVARTIAGHLVDRYGADALGFTWSIFNEPDLGIMFWRTDWNELQRFYDYTTDAILRAVEDRGYDSERVFIGGLELGIFLRLQEFLAHCSPRASAKGALPLNAAVADRHLDGKRSQRVEKLCGAHQGKGCPCDFISIHAYGRSETMAARLIRAKEMALAIDPEYYRDLWINSHESCPNWNPPPDEAAADSYLGNGYFPSWCADVISRQLGQAARDPRYAMGETLLTVWPPPLNFAGLNAVSRRLLCDDDGDGRSDRAVTIPTPIFHVLGMLSDLGDCYWVLPQQQVGGHVVGGFASRGRQNVVRVVLYTHHAQDTQSRSEADFDVALELDKLGWQGDAEVEEFRFDRDHNSYFRLGRTLRQRHTGRAQPDSARLDAALRALDSDDAEAQRQALGTLEALMPSIELAGLPAVAKLAEQAEDETVRQTARALRKNALGSAVGSRDAYSREEVEQICQLAQCRPTGSATIARPSDGHLRLNARVAGNGLNILVIRPSGAGPGKKGLFANIGIVIPDELVTECIRLLLQKINR